jgi:signal peptidase II
MKFLYRILLIFITILVFTGCDQTIKRIAQHNLKYTEPISYLGGIVQFQYAENPGIVLSIGSDLPEETRFIVFVLITFIALLSLLVYITFTKNDNKFRLFAYSLILSGGFGNLIDRIRNDGRVIDYIILGSKSIHTAIFNLADVLVIFGMMLLIYMYVSKKVPTKY